MGSSDISDSVKLGLIMLLMIFVFGTGVLVYNVMRHPFESYITNTENRVYSADMETMIDLCTVNEVNGATLYTAMTQYGAELAGIVWQNSDSQDLYGSLEGATGSLDDLLKRIEDNGFNTRYNVFRSEPISGIDYQPQSLFIGIKEVS